MPYPALDPGKYGPGMPLDPSNLEVLWKGMNKTNGFLMRNIDGRVPALIEPLGRLRIDAGSVLAEDDVVPWGNGLWRDINAIDTQPGIAHAEKPTKGWLVGLLQFNQGWQAGNPIAPHGVPSYSKASIIRKGYVGFKTAMTAVGQEENYLAYLKGDSAQDLPAVRTTYDEWVATYKAGADGDRLGLFVGNDSGFPIISLVTAATLSNPTLANATFVGFVEILEKENQAVYVDVSL